MKLESLLLLRQCLVSQQLQVGTPGFAETAARAAQALEELDMAIAAAQEPVE